MSLKSVKSIVPQLRLPVVGPVSSRLMHLGVVLGVFGCAHVQVPVRAPQTPATVEEAKAYIAGRDKQLQILDYELNQQTIACYEKFFVSSCLDDVRLQGARLRRAHVEAQGQANDLIRLDDYAKRRVGKENMQPMSPVR